MQKLVVEIIVTIELSPRTHYTYLTYSCIIKKLRCIWYNVQVIVELGTRVLYTYNIRDRVSAEEH